MFQIEKFIPLPVKQLQGSKYPFRLMQVGDSFLIPSNSQDSTRTRLRGLSAAKKVPSVKIRSAAVEGGIRFWRIA